MTSVLRPLSFEQILDNAFGLYRENFATFFGIALLPQIPVVLYWLVAPLITAGDAGTVQTGSLLMLPYNLFAFVLMMGALTHATALAYSGGNAAIGASMREGLRHWLAIAVATTFAWILIMFGMILLIVPGLILMAMFFGYAPAAVLENLGPFASLGRSRALSRGARMRVLGIMIFAWIITALPAIGMWVVAGASMGASALAGAADSTWLMSLIQATSVVLSSVTWPFLMIVTVLLYFDRRARTEAPDLEEAAASLASST